MSPNMFSPGRSVQPAHSSTYSPTQDTQLKLSAGFAARAHRQRDNFQLTANFAEQRMFLMIYKNKFSMILAG
jgi:hypothetical protein